VLISTPLPAGVTQVSNQAIASGSNFPSLPTDDPGTLAGSDPTSTPVTAVPVLSANKSATVVVDTAPIGPSPGDTLLYQITIANSGNGAATGVTFSDTPDPNTTLVVGSVQTNLGTVTSGNTAGNTSVGANIGPLPGGASAIISFRVIIDTPLPAGTIQVSNQGTVSAAGVPSVPTDDAGTPTSGDPTNTPITAAPILTADKVALLSADADGDGQVSPGDTLLYQITIINSGNGTATGVTFSDTPDPNTTLVAGSVQTSLGTVTSGNAGIPPVAANIGALPGGGASAIISFRVRIASALPAGVTQISNQGIISSSQLGPVSTNDPATAQGADSTVTPITNPTAITLVSFTATPEGDTIVVRWVTSAERDTWGFHLYRSADGRRDHASRLTPQLILGTGRGQGASYSWADTTAEAGVHYTYWLQEVEVSGKTNEYGPASAVLGPAAGQYRVFVPIVQR
jgi:uncharacterized repeat protein (TIGR01451 family)